jgi:hypothetical protein
MQKNHALAPDTKEHTCDAPVADIAADLPQSTTKGIAQRLAHGPSVFDVGDIRSDNPAIVTLKAFQPISYRLFAAWGLIERSR